MRYNKFPKILHINIWNWIAWNGSEGWWIGFLYHVSILRYSRILRPNAVHNKREEIFETLKKHF